ncbi:MAG TPA: sigma-70 family RNA polymerase sigma factor [Actinomycetota bacterium]
MQSTGHGQQGRRGRPSPFGRSRLTTSATSPAPEDLMELVCQGDHQAFARLYDRFASQAFGLALRVCEDRAVAEDAVQEAFLALWRKPTAYRPDRGSVPAYLLTLVHHRAVDAVRHEQRLRVRERELAVAQQPQSDEELVEAASASGLRDRVRAALAQLTHRQRQALELAYFSGLTVSDVAKRLDIPLGTAKTRVRDGMIRLRSLLAAEGAEGEIG